jgi:hypothetical protein
MGWGIYEELKISTEFWKAKKNEKECRMTCTSPTVFKGKKSWKCCRTQFFLFNYDSIDI